MDTLDREGLLSLLSDLERKAAAIRALLDAYGISVPSAGALRAEGRPVVAMKASSPRVSKEVAIRQAARQLLSERGPMHRNEILAHCIKQGLLGTEKKPINRLATILSAAKDEFESDGRGTFGLRGAFQKAERDRTETAGTDGDGSQTTNQPPGPRPPRAQTQRTQPAED